MTDRDVVTRVAEIFDRAVIPTKPRQSHHKIPFVTTIKGVAAARLMRALIPLMSPLRRAQIERALRDHRPVRHPATESNGLIEAGSELCWETANGEERTAWLAGLLEGEGSFISARSDGHWYPQVQMTMCDPYVLDRAMSLMPSSRLYAISDERAIARGWSQAWMVRASGPSAAVVMKTVRQWMGSRRTMAIDRALASWRPIRLAPLRTSCIVPGCTRRHAARGLCNTHYMSWSRDRAKGRAPRIIPLR